jgi:hypothetical protein
MPCCEPANKGKKTGSGKSKKNSQILYDDIFTSRVDILIL